MKTTYRILFFLTFFQFSCFKNADEIDIIKWDFYKKNIDVSFKINGDIIPSYIMNLTIEREQLSQEKSKACFFGVFKYKEYTSLNSRDSITGAPLVHTICYAAKSPKIIGYYSGHSLYIDSINEDTEFKENIQLQNICKNELVNDFLRKYQRP